MSTSAPQPNFPERGSLNLPKIADDILASWEQDGTFQKSIETRPADRPYVFFEEPPSANGKPDIHHVMARAIKDIFCRFHTLKVPRRTESGMGHRPACGVGRGKRTRHHQRGHRGQIDHRGVQRGVQKAVMRYTDIWNDLTRKMGYWVDMDAPYVTYENKYIESVWWLLTTRQQRLALQGLHHPAVQPCGRNGIEFTRTEPAGCVPRRQGHHGRRPIQGAARMRSTRARARRA